MPLDSSGAVRQLVGDPYVLMQYGLILLVGTLVVFSVSSAVSEKRMSPVQAGAIAAIIAGLLVSIILLPTITVIVSAIALATLCSLTAFVTVLLIKKLMDIEYGSYEPQ